MEKQIIPNNTPLLASKLQFTLDKPIKALYEGICKPIFTVPPSAYRLNASRMYASLRVVRGSCPFWDMLAELDRSIPRVAWEQRKVWFPTDLHENTLEEFTEAYRTNLTDPKKHSSASTDTGTEVTFNLYLGELRNGNDLPVPVFRAKDKQAPIHLSNSLQELAWGATQGRVTLLVECSGLWTKEESFGLGWRVRQIVYRSEPRMPRGSLSFINNADIRAHEWKVAPPPNALSEAEQGNDAEAKALATSAPAAVLDSDVPHQNPLLDHDD